MPESIDETIAEVNTDSTPGWRVFLPLVGVLAFALLPAFVRPTCVVMTVWLVARYWSRRAIGLACVVGMTGLYAAGFLLNPVAHLLAKGESPWAVQVVLLVLGGIWLLAVQVGEQKRSRGLLMPSFAMLLVICALTTYLFYPTWLSEIPHAGDEGYHILSVESH